MRNSAEIGDKFPFQKSPKLDIYPNLNMKGIASPSIPCSVSKSQAI